MSKYYKTTFTVTVLSQEPIYNMALEDIAREVNEGDCVLHGFTSKSKTVSKLAMIKLLYDAGSEPGFFQIEEHVSKQKQR